MIIHDDKPALLDELITIIAQYRIVHRFSSIDILGLPYNNNQAALYFLKLISECLPNERVHRIKKPRSIQMGYRYPYFDRATFLLIKYLSLNDKEKTAIIYCFNELNIKWAGQFATETIPGHKQSAEQLLNKSLKPKTGLSVIDAIKKQLRGGNNEH